MKQEYSALVLWVASAIKIALQLATIPITAQLLTPSEVGEFAIILPLVTLTTMIAQSGIGSTLLREPIQNKLLWNSCVIANILSGAIANLVFATIIYLLLKTTTFDQNILYAAIILSSSIFLNTVATIPAAAIQRQGAFTKTAIIEVSSIVIGIITLYLYASRGIGIYSISLQYLNSAIVRCLLSIYLSPLQITADFNFKVARGHLISGGRILFSNLILFINKPIETWLLGQTIGHHNLGLYTMAGQITKAPFLFLTPILQQTIYPAVAAEGYDVLKVKQCLIDFTQIALLVIFPAATFVFVAAHDVLSLLLPQKWLEASTVVSILMPYSAMQGVIWYSTYFSLAAGESKHQVSSAAIVVTVNILAICAFSVFEFNTFLPLYLLASLVGTAYAVDGHLKSIDCGRYEYLVSLVPGLIAGFTSAGVCLAIASFEASLLVTTSVQVIATTGITILILLDKRLTCGRLWQRIKGHAVGSWT